MMDAGFSGGIYKICVWIMRFAWLNLLWIVFTLLGLVLFGFFPATASMFAVERKWIRGQEDLPIFQTFWKEYKASFIKANLLGLVLTAFGILLIMNYRIAGAMNTFTGQVLSYLLLFISFIYGMILLYIFPVYSHYKVKVLDCIKFAFLVGFSSPLMTVMIVLSAVLYYLISMAVPGVIPVLTGSCLSFTAMWFAHCAFKRIELKSGYTEAGKKNE
ncbi:YesL family protein [Halobacillus salinarum]|uniref:YesL family protein n=1 Tax=Halobacillus salinarum TaxID=2932257 RepID=A0ABY4EIC3_9BACI|nr:YesL family protein [Halobacillus salinarum]UOQ44175.1 YesL family protein [Halobacillus salinarum]